MRDVAGSWRSWRGTLTRRQGMATVEHVALLAVIALALMAGVAALGTSTRQAAQRLVAGYPGEGQAVGPYPAGTQRLSQNVAQPPSAVQNSPHGRGRPCYEMGYGIGSQPFDRSSSSARGLPLRMDGGAHRGLAWAATAIACGTLLTYIGFLLGRRRPATARRLVLPEADEADDVDIQARIFAKRQSLLRALASDHELLAKNQIAVRHLMTRELLVVSPRTRVDALQAMMAEHRVHHLLVCEKDHRLLGVISDRDLKGRPGRTASEVMTADPCCVEPDAPLGPAITFLIQRQISCLPVVSEGKVCGVITTTDVTLSMQCVLQLWLRLGQEMRHDPLFMEELARVGQIVERELGQQHSRIQDLYRSLEDLRQCGQEDACQAVPSQLAEVLAAVKRLTSLFAHTHALLREQCRHSVPGHDSQTDPLTGLPSQNSLLEILETLLAMRLRQRDAFSLLLLALDPRLLGGGPSGAVDPAVLKTVASGLMTELRGSDLVTRYGENGFALVLPRTSAEGAEIVCRRIAKMLARSLGDRDRTAFCLIRIAPGDGDTVEAFLERAEASLHPVPSAACPALSGCAAGSP